MNPNELMEKMVKMREALIKDRTLFPKERFVDLYSKFNTLLPELEECVKKYNDNPENKQYEELFHFIEGWSNMVKIIY